MTATIQYLEWLADDRGWRIGDALFYARFGQLPDRRDEILLLPPVEVERCGDNVVRFPRHKIAYG